METAVHGTGRPGSSGGDGRSGTLRAAMHELLSSLIGVPAVILLAGGLGIVAVTLLSRVRSRPGRGPIRWAHLVFGVGLSGAGILLLQLDVSVIGVR
jgi:hypothetical protein